MKQFVLTLLGSLLGVGLALLLYDRFIVQPREARQAQAASMDLSRAARDARHITDSVDASVRNSVDSARQAFQAQADDQDKRRMAVEALVQTQMYKAALTEAFVAHGAWPTRAAEAGLPTDKADTGGAVRNIHVGEHGVVTITFDTRFAEGSWIRLIPRADTDTYQVRWECRVSGDADLKRYLPTCTQG